MSDAIKPEILGWAFGIGSAVAFGILFPFWMGRIEGQIKAICEILRELRDGKR